MLQLAKLVLLQATVVAAFLNQRSADAALGGKDKGGQVALLDTRMTCSIMLVMHF